MIYQGIEPEVEGCSPWCVALWYMHMYSGVGTIYLGSGWLVLVFLNTAMALPFLSILFIVLIWSFIVKGMHYFLG